MESKFTYTGKNSGFKPGDFEEEDGNYLLQDVSSDDLSKCNVLTTFMGKDYAGDDKGFQFLYNPKGNSVYLCAVDKNGEIAKKNIEVYDVFKDNVNIESGDECTINLEGSNVRLRVNNTEAERDVTYMSSDGNRFDLSKVFRNERNDTDWELLNSVKVKDSTAKSDSKKQDTETTEQDTEADTKKETAADTKKETDAASETAAAQQTESQTDAAADAGSASPATQETTSSTVVQPEPTPKSGSNGGLLAATIVLALLAAGGAAGCYLLWKQVSELQKKQKASSKSAAEQKDFKEKYEQTVKRVNALIKERENLTSEKTELEEELKKAKRNSNPATDDGRLETYKAEVKRLEDKLKETQKMYDDVKASCSQLQRENNALKAQASSSKSTSSVAASNSVAAIINATLEKEDTVQLCTNPDLLSAKGSLTFLAINISLVGEAALSTAPFKRAQIAVVENQAYLNPYYFQNLGKRRQSGEDFAQLEAIFAISGLQSTTQIYGLDAFTPAELSQDASGNYKLVKKGSIVLGL